MTEKPDTLSKYIPFGEDDFRPGIFALEGVGVELRTEERDTVYFFNLDMQGAKTNTKVALPANPELLRQMAENILEISREIQIRVLLT